jgi:hypothetical protein
VDIAGATGSTYTLTQADVGKAITVVASYTDAQGPGKSVTSVATGLVAAAAVDTAGALTISGTAENGQTLTANLTDADGGVTGTTYQWKANGVNISGATSQTFALRETDVGKKITVQATYTDALGSGKSVTSAETSDANGKFRYVYVRKDTAAGALLTMAELEIYATVNGAVTNIARSVNNAAVVLTTSGGGNVGANGAEWPSNFIDGESNEWGWTNGNNGNAVSTTSHWALIDLGAAYAIESIKLFRSNDSGMQPRAEGTSVWMTNTAAITTATNTTLTSRTDVKQAIAQTTSGTTWTSNGITADFQWAKDDLGSIAAISGTAIQGQVLTAGAITDADGGVTGITYQWKADGTNISGATASTFTLRSTDFGKKITVQANYTDAHGSGKSVTSAETTDVTGVFRYVYVRKDSNMSMFTMAEIEVYATVNGVLTNVARSINNPAVVVTASGGAGFGTGAETLANFTDGERSEWGWTNGSQTTVTNSTWHWALVDLGAQYAIESVALYRSSDEVGQSRAAGTSVYLANLASVNELSNSQLTSRTDVKQVIAETTLATTWTNNGITGEFNALGTLNINGTAALGQTLTANLTDADGGVTGVTYQWMADGSNIVGATAATYALRESDVGKNITVTASYADAWGPGRMVTSTETPDVTGTFRYVYLRRDSASTGLFTVAEIEVYASVGGVVKNIAIAANNNAVVVTAQYPGFSGAELVSEINDGENNDWGHTSNTGAKSQWVLVDLGAAYAIESVSLYRAGSDSTYLEKDRIIGTSVWLANSSNVTSLSNTVLSSTATVKQAIAQITAGTTWTDGRYVSRNFTTNPPVVLDLNGDGQIEYTQQLVDDTGNGDFLLTSWVKSSDGILFADKNSDGRVSGSQEFVFADAANGLTDMQGLARDHDSNGDGVLDASDADFSLFKVWQDLNSDGMSQSNEVRTLTEAGIQSLELTSDGQVKTPAAGVTEHGQSTATLADGSSMVTADVAFAFKTAKQISGQSGVDEIFVLSSSDTFVKVNGFDVGEGQDQGDQIDLSALLASLGATQDDLSWVTSGQHLVLQVKQSDSVSAAVVFADMASQNLDTHAFMQQHVVL